MADPPKKASIKRYGAPKRQPGLLVPARDAAVDKAFTTAVAEHLGPSPTVFHELISETVHIDLYRHEPPGRGQAIIMTGGVSDLPTSPPDGKEDFRWIELFIRLPASWPQAEGQDMAEERWWPFRWLKQLGRMVHEHKTWFAHLHTIPNGDPPRPFADGTALIGFILVRPEGEDAPLARIDAAGRPIECLELVPVTAAEMDLRLAQGSEALLQRLREAGVLGQALDPARASTVSGEDAGAEAAEPEGEDPTFGDICQAAMQSTRSAYAVRQQRMGFFSRISGHMRAPAWLRTNPEDKLNTIYQDQWLLRKRGSVVWGHIVQANELLFREGRHDHPAAALWSPDAYFDSHVSELARIAGSLYESKGEETGDPEMQRFADLLANELERQMRLVIPRQLTGGRRVFYTSIMVHRAHLPKPVLAVPFFPLLVSLTDSVATSILPAREWSELAQRMWLALAEEG